MEQLISYRTLVSLHVLAISIKIYAKSSTGSAGSSKIRFSDNGIDLYQY